MQVTDDFEIVIGIPYRKRDRWYVFPSRSSYIKSMISKGSLMYFKNGDITTLECRFRDRDVESILFGKKVVEDHLAKINDFYKNYRVEIEEAQRQFFKKEKLRLFRGIQLHIRRNEEYARNND
jgi:hypothetical protein